MSNQILSKLKTNIENTTKVASSKVMLKTKGDGAGGANTNASGKPFEEKTSIIPELIKLDFKKKIFGNGKKDYYYIKEFTNKKVLFLEQNGFKKYIEQNFNKNVRRKPDEAFIIQENNNITIKILEKKNQNGEGSVFDKIFNGPTIKEEYQYHLGNNFKVEYSYCLSDYFKNKLNDSYFDYYKKLCNKENIKIFYADDPEYFKNICKWVIPDNQENNDNKMLEDLSDDLQDLKISDNNKKTLII